MPSAISAGLGRQLEHLGPAEHRLQRRAKFVRKRGEEFVLEAIGASASARTGAFVGEQLLAFDFRLANPQERATVAIKTGGSTGCVM